MPLYHTMGIHSLLAMHLVGGCFVSQARWDAGEALALIEQRADHVALPRADALPRPRPPPRPRAPRPLLGARARLRGRGDDVERSSSAAPRSSGRRSSSTTTARPRSTRSRSGATSARKPGCAGRPALNARLRLTGEGEIAGHLSSDEAFAGYWNRPDADEKAIRDGWYHTGDIGRIDEDGDLWIDGRVDDMIISGGENVHPLEVEDVLAGHPGVREVAVVGAPDDRLGQRVVAVVVGTGDGARSSTRTVSPPRSRASSGRASTASSRRCRRARRARSCGGCSETRR